MPADLHAAAASRTRIRKHPEQLRPVPHLLDYEATRAAFDWESARSALDGLPAGGGLNMAYEAVDRHLKHGRGDKTAIRWIGKSGARRVLTFAQLATETNRFANALHALGLPQGERVFVLMGRLPELYVSVLGALKARCVVTPLFSQFGPEPIAARAEIADARLLVTTPEIYQRKIAGLRERLPGLRHVILVGDGPAEGPGVLRWKDVVDAAPPLYVIGRTEPETMALLHFTSGTTGRPKGAVHVHEAVLAHTVTGRYALDLHEDDIFWCTADPGWITGTSYGILAPLCNGVTSVVVEAEFDAQTWYSVLQDERVSVWYTAPTAIRMMMKLGAQAVRGYDLSSLRFAASVGEPLNPEAVLWGQEAFGLPFHDNWWQTETGGIMVANYAAVDVKPGSMGKPLPGIDAAIVHRTAAAGLEFVTTPDTDGELALKTPWPSMMRGYLHEEERYRKCFAEGWYLTGDLARRDAEGYYWFVGRADDVIKSAGHLIGPFEVESVLMEHPAVAEAGVIGKPDPVVGEVVKAFVALKAGFEPGEPLRRELLGHARKRLGAAVAPKEIDFRANLPKTRSGKIMRRLLKARELGLPEGDLSTLESDEKWKLHLDRAHLQHLLREMLRIRRFEAKCVELYQAQQIRGFLHLYDGEEAVAVGVMGALQPPDAVVATYREHGQALARGVPMERLLAEMLGKAEGCCRGRGGSMHVFDGQRRFFGGNAIVGGGLPLAAGIAMADLRLRPGAITACFFGEGAVTEGAFHETLNLASLWRLPVLFVCENNLYAMGVPLADAESQTAIHRKAEAYRVRSESVDGMDPVTVEAAATRAVEHVRSGEGPFFLECRTYRFRAHSMFDTQAYRTREEIAGWRERDPIERLRGWMRDNHLVTEAQFADLEQTVEQEIAAAVAFAQAGSLEPVEDLERFVLMDTVVQEQHP